MKGKGQVSVELLIVIGFVVVLFIPLLIFLYYKTSELNKDIDGLQSRLLSSKLAFIANSLGYLGGGSSMKTEFMLPDRVSTLQFRPLGNGGEVLITLNDGSQVSQVTEFPFDSAATYQGGVNYNLEFVSDGGKITVHPSG